MQTKSKEKKHLRINVLDAARQRIAQVFNDFPCIYVSFSGGKDSTVMLHLVADEAKKRKRKFGLFFVDMEAQYKLTIDFIEEMFEEYKDIVEPFWCAEQIKLRNAVSQFEPQWKCWEEGIEWVRQKSAYTNHDVPNGTDMEFEDYVQKFGQWYAKDKLCACFVGIRTAESLNRWRTIAGKKQSFEWLQYTTRVVDGIYNIYPIYDWSTEDVWVYLGKHKKPYNRLYDRMHAAGLSIHQQRICQPYGDDQRKGLWLFKIIEPDTWGKVVLRVNGANQGALYAKESGNILGRIKIKKPEGHTWESFASLIIETMPANIIQYYKDKIKIFIDWQIDNGEYDKEATWLKVCKSLLSNDFLLKDLGFVSNETRIKEQKNLINIIKRRRKEWTI